MPSEVAGIEVPGRLVGQKQRRTVHERARDRDSLLFAAGQLVRVALHLVLEADETEHLGDLRVDDVLATCR